LGREEGLHRLLANCSWLVEGTYSCLRIMLGVVSEVLEDLLAAFGWQNAVSSVFNLTSHFPGGVVDLMLDTIDHVSCCVENGGHGGLERKRCGREQVQ
jgi:hypothetical protein